jgi:hypothetical protein
VADKPRLFSLPVPVKDVSDWVKLVVLLAGMFFGYQHLVDRVDAYGSTLVSVQKQTVRMERYLSSQDPQYWQKVKGLDEP